MCGIPAIYVRLIQMEILKLASFNRVLLCTWHVFTPKPPICSLHLHCSISNSKNSDLPGPLRCLFVCGWLARAVAYHKKDLNAVHNVGFWFSQFYFCTLKKSSFLARCSFSTAWNAGHEEQDTAFITRVENAIALHSYVFFFLAVAKWVQDILPPLPETNPLLLISVTELFEKEQNLLFVLWLFLISWQQEFQTPVWPLIGHSWAARWHALPGCQQALQLHGLEMKWVFAQWFYGYIAPLIIYSHFIAIPLPSWSCRSLCCEGWIWLNKVENKLWVLL